jgi:endonuclease/exonuclease/phosphatase family metal-dependent hydrolase
MTRMAAAVTLALTALSAGAQPAPSLRVVSYNIHHGEGVDGKLDLARIAKVMTDAKADLVALQEVDKNTTRTKKVDQAAELARLSGLNGVFGKAIDLQGGEYGQAVLSRFPLTLKKVHVLPGKPGIETRVAVETTVTLPSGELTFVGTHFAHDDAPSRKDQAAKVIELFGTRTGPVILAGDFNATPESEPMKAFAAGWGFATPAGKGLLTIPAENPRRQIDFILVRPAARWAVVEAKVIPEAVASDHRPVLAVVTPLAP